MTCPSCEYNKQRAQLWRHEAYKHSGHPLDWEPELVVRQKPLTEEEIRGLADDCLLYQPEGYEESGVFGLIRAVERAHGIGTEARATLTKPCGSLGEEV